MNESPLSAADLKAVQQGLYAAVQAEQELERLADCGLECGEETARCQFLKGVMQKMLERYSSTPSARTARKS